MSWLSLFGAVLKLATEIAGALRDRGLIAAGEVRGRAESDAEHAREATARGAEMREIASRPPAPAAIEKRLEEGSA